MTASNPRRLADAASTGTVTGVRVDLLFVPDCPNVPVIRQRLVDAANIVRTPIEITEREIADPDQAATAGMTGSPTVLINGTDVLGSDGNEGGSVSCRLFLPTVAQLIEAMRR
jgi:hypothetical protein